VIDFDQIKAFLASRCSASRERNNAELREMGENTPFSFNVHTP
jgi:hypothetical protein